VNSKQTSISVVVPVMNSGKTLGRTFDSILSQTLLPEKIIVVYDDSSDNTLEIVNKYIKTYPSVFFFIHGPDKGIGAARQEAIMAVDTQFVSFLDSDDWYMQNALETLLSAVHETGVSCGMVCRVYPNGKRVPRCIHSANRFITHEMLKTGNPIPMSTTMYKTSLLKEQGGFDSNLLWIEDYDLHLRITKVAPYALVKKIVSFYTIHENPTMSRRTHEYAKWTAIVWMKHGFIDWKSIWHSIVYTITSFLLVPVNIIKRKSNPQIRVIHYEYLQILSGYMSGLVKGYRH